MLLLQIKITHLQAGWMLGAILGFLLGLIPLILGIIKRKIKFGILGFIGAIIGNAILGIILSVPIISVCIYLIMRKQTPEIASESEVSTTNSENS